MRVCLVTENYNPKYGGQYTAVKNVVNICKSIKIKILIIHKKSIHFKNKNLLENIFKKSDVIHLFGGWTLFYLNIFNFAKKLKKKIIIHPMGLFDPQSFKQKRLKKEIAWNLYQKQMLIKADLIHCGSYIEEKNLKKLNSKFKTICLPFSIDKKNIKKKFLKKLNYKCIFFSRLHNQKGLDKLIDAWKIIGDNRWKLDIVGFGEKEYYTKKFNLDNFKNIRFLRPIVKPKEKYKLFDKYDFLALPTLSESFGLAILEALARRLPVLTTNKTPWENIQIKNSGWIINDSFEELKLILYEIFNSSNKEFFLKKKNTFKVVKDYDTHKVSKLYFKAYKNLKFNRN